MALRAVEKVDTKTGGIAADRLRSLVDRIERLEEERKALGSDIRDIYAEAKSAGFDIKVLRQLIRVRKQEPADVEEQETLLDVYRRHMAAVKTQQALKADVSLATKVGRKLFPASEAELIADIVERDLPFYDPAISREFVAGMTEFQRHMGLLNANVSYDDVVATQFSQHWKA